MKITYLVSCTCGNFNLSFHAHASSEMRKMRETAYKFARRHIALNESHISAVSKVATSMLRRY
jgi:hypothetical protein